MRSWQSYLANGFSRIGVKNRFYPGMDFNKTREKMNNLDTLNLRLDKGFVREDFTISDLPCQWIKNDQWDKRRIILYLHGGGFCMRTPAMHGQLLGRICRETSAIGLMVDYRLAPEHPYPAAIDDTCQAYEWLLTQGYDPKQIVVAGDSAGGTLTMHLLVKLRDAGKPLPACAVMLSPALAPILSTESAKENARKDAMLSVKGIQAFHQAYEPEESMISLTDIFMDTDITGLPPLLFQASKAEILRDDSILGHEKAQQARVETQLQLWEGQQHVFQLFYWVPEAREAVRKIGVFVNQYL